MPTPPSTPKVLDWSQWLERRRRVPGQGRHVLFVGPTQSGKTVLARKLAELRSFVIVFGTKAHDSSLDAYLADGYRRIYEWPPKPKELRPDASGAVRLILWPKIVKREDLRRHRDHYARCLEDAFLEGHWTIVADEGLYLASRKGLNLDQELADVAYGAASNKVSLYLCLQRPSGLSRVTWSSVSDAMVFHLGVTNDIRELASLGTYDPREAAAAIKNLRGHQFLELPCRGGAEWSVSEVRL